MAIRVVLRFICCLLDVVDSWFPYGVRLAGNPDWNHSALAAVSPAMGFAGGRITYFTYFV